MISDQIKESSQQLSTVLKEEVEHFRRLTLEHQPLEKNHSQMKVIYQVWDELSTQMNSKVGRTADQEVEFGRKLIRFSNLWGVYKQWFAQRKDNEILHTLQATDLIAHDCYRAILDKVSELGIQLNPKQTTSYPMTFFDTRKSMPFTISRSPSPVTLHIDRFPIPVIGIPWSLKTLWHHALCIHHEVGHNLDADLGDLSGEISKHLRSKLENQCAGTLSPGDPQMVRIDAWCNWTKEIVADFLAVMLAGPPFLGFMVHYLAISTKSVFCIDESKPHPPNYLRVHLLAKFVKDFWTGTDGDVVAYVDDIIGEWNSFCGSVQAPMQAYLHEISIVTDVIGKQPLARLNGHGKEYSLGALVSPKKTLLGDLVDAAQALQNGYAPYRLDARHVPSATQLAFETDPTNTSVHTNTLTELIKKLPSGTMGVDDHCELLAQKFLEDLGALDLD